MPSLLFRRSLPLATFALLLLPVSRLCAQEAPTPEGPPPMSSAPPPQPEIEHSGQALKVSVNLVDVYFSVRDKNGFVTGLKKNDCEVAEDHAAQTIKNLSQEKNLPLTIGILLDTSGSQTNVLPLEKESGARFLKEVLTPKDEAFLISFDVNVDLLSDYTNSAGELRRAIDKASINEASSSGGVPGIGGGPFPTSNPRGTLLYDAVFLGAHDKLLSQTGRKVLIILTDGQDQGSQVKIKEAIEAAQKANVIVYPILIADRASYAAAGMIYTGSGQMDQLARETGGRVINVGNSGRRLEDAFDQIQDELRTQYLLSYTSTNKKEDGTFRHIEMTCGKDNKVQARRGYYALTPEEQTATE